MTERESVKSLSPHERLKRYFKKYRSEGINLEDRTLIGMERVDSVHLLTSAFRVDIIASSKLPGLISYDDPMVSFTIGKYGLEECLVSDSAFSLVTIEGVTAPVKRKSEGGFASIVFPEDTPGEIKTAYAKKFVDWLDKLVAEQEYSPPPQISISTPSK